MTRSPAHWATVERLYHAALARPAGERATFLAEACAGDEALRRDVESLLAQPASGDNVLARGAVAAAAGLMSDVGASALTGRRIGAYHVLAQIGAGGMGEVYRARDTRLGRDVAIKILPREFTSHPDRLARFEREARVLASLNHPHIAAIYGIEDQSTDVGAGFSRPVHALVLELVEGETLADRIARVAGPGLPLKEALDFARQIADALDAAHEKGIVHRDLKPANIKITPEGVVKVLDFGLAKLDPRGSDRETQSPTITAGDTREGLIIGTAAYMSPEQARGLAVDKRTDIWAFGCVVYEMLCGRAAFSGETVSDIIARILEGEPDWARLDPSIPISIRKLLRRCLERDQRRRLRDAADARLEVDDAIAEKEVSTISPEVTRPRVLLPTLVVAAMVLLVVMAVYGRRTVTSDPTGVDRNIERLTFDPGLTTAPALSPDGRLLAYASDRSGRDDLDIWVNQVGGGTPVRLTDDPAEDRDPDFSPDGRQIVFRSDRNGGGVYMVPALGGSQRLLVQEARAPRFSPDATRIAYWTGQFRGDPSGTASSVFILTIAGGTPTQLARGFVVARDPVWAPDGQSLLVLGRRDRSSPLTESFDWWWVPLDGRAPVRSTILDYQRWRETQQRERLHVGAWTSSGVLIAANGELWTVPVSPQTGRTMGKAVQITAGAGLYRYPTTSRDGQIVFGDSTGQRIIERAELTRSGLNSPPLALYTDSNGPALRVSATRDGNLLVFERQSADHVEIWQKELRSGREQFVLTLASNGFVNPTVSPHGIRIGYSAPTPQPLSVTVNGDGYALDLGGGVPRKICVNCGVYEFLSDDRRVVVTDGDIRVRIIDVTTQSAYDAIAVRDARIDRPNVSPDERWVAFRRTIGNAAKVFVAPLRGPSEGPAPTSMWSQINEPTTTGRPAGWSADSSVLYLLLDTDGFRCLWGQHIDDRGRLVGPPFPVRHFHDRRGANNISTSLGNAITPQGFLYETTRTIGSLWRLTTKVDR